MKIEKIVIATHGRFGEELLKSAEMIIGTQSQIKACSYLEGMTLEAFSLQVLQEIEDDKTLLFTDLYGGTPFNVARGLSKSKKFILFSEVNLMMLIEAAMNYTSMDADELVPYIQNIKDNSLRIIKNGEEIS